jgi:glycerol-3-phosphate cytidylyltransferase
LSKKVVITYGTFDLFHIGHLELLKRLSKLGDKLIVAVSTDKFNERKGKKTIIPYKQRAKIIKSIKYVDKVIPEKSWKQKRKDIKKYGVDIFAIGDDWKGKFDFLKDDCKVVYLKRTDGISSTKLKKSLSSLSAINPDDIKMAFEILKRIKDDLE